MADRDPAADERRGALTPVTEFLQTETASGIVLLAAAIGALVWANASPTGYDDFWTQHLNVVIDESLQHWINDALMAVFFFVVGLEIKRELVVGDLRDPRTAALPAIAALGGMVVPALVYLAWNFGGDGRDGWGIPMATDIAFAVGVLSLLSKRVPSTLRLFLLTLAIVDDVGAILVIAVVYTDDLAAGWLVGAAAALVVMLGLRALRVGSAAAYVLPAVALWYALYESGVHATIAGVIVGLLTPHAVSAGPPARPSSGSTGSTPSRASSSFRSSPWRTRGSRSTEPPCARQQEARSAGVSSPDWSSGRSSASPPRRPSRSVSD